MGRGRAYFVYILASRIGGTLYIGVTNDLIRRVYEHRQKLAQGFTSKYDVAKLVYFEQHADIEGAIVREKRLKKWNRAWKIRLVEEKNPNWDDLYPVIAKPGVRFCSHQFFKPRERGVSGSRSRPIQIRGYWIARLRGR